MFNHMVDYKGNDRKLDLIFHALADATRRKILVLVAEKERSVSDLAKPFDMDELAARVASIARRRGGRSEGARL
jgi:DNA-binding transcriptional ArsR family regulator